MDVGNAWLRSTNIYVYRHVLDSEAIPEIFMGVQMTSAERETKPIIGAGRSPLQRGPGAEPNSGVKE